MRQCAAVRRSAPAHSRSVVRRAYKERRTHTHRGVTPVEAQSNWPADRREMWHAEELIRFVFPGAVVISRGGVDVTWAAIKDALLDPAGFVRWRRNLRHWDPTPCADCGVELMPEPPRGVRRLAAIRRLRPRVARRRHGTPRRLAVHPVPGAPARLAADRRRLPADAAQRPRRRPRHPPARRTQACGCSAQRRSR